MGDTFPRVKAAAVQAAPVFLNREATVDKACSLITEAARAGASLIAFPEVFVPGYPYWIRLDNPFRTTPFFVELVKNAVEVPGPATAQAIDLDGPSSFNTGQNATPSLRSAYVF